MLKTQNQIHPVKRIPANSSQMFSHCNRLQNQGQKKHWILHSLPRRDISLKILHFAATYVRGIRHAVKVRLKRLVSVIVIRVIA